MTAIVYGNLSAEIVNDGGVRVRRLVLQQAMPGVLNPHPAGTPQKLPMLGREQELAEAIAAIQARRPAEFHSACGFGKTTLLENLTAAASERGLAPACLYVHADRGRVGDLLQQLVDRLYVVDRPVKLTPQQCAQLLGQVSAVVAVDDLDARPDEVGYLLDVLSGCSVVIGSSRPVLGYRGTSHNLRGLAEQAALALIVGDLGRPLTAEELAAARRLVTSVKGQPLHLRQCAALVREGRHSVRSLAQQAAYDAEALDRLSINALAQYQRRALGVLALAAGTLLPASMVETIGQLAYVGECLESLRRRGLAEQRDDRFGLPSCKASSYRQLLLSDLHLAASARDLSTWLTAADPTVANSQSAAEAAVAIMEYAGERGDWRTVVQLARAAERVMFIAGRWEAWQHTLSQGLEAARATADRAAEAFFAHQQGARAFCQDQLDDARQLLHQALTLRQQLGDAVGAEVTQHNLGLLEPPAPRPPPKPGVPRRLLITAGSVLATLALTAGTVAIADALRGHRPPGVATSPSTAATSGTTSSANVIPQTISFTSSPPAAAKPGGTYLVTATGGGSGNPVSFSIDPSSSSVCTIAAATVTFDNAGNCIIDANQAGNSQYQPAPQAQQTVPVGSQLLAQTISFTSSPPTAPVPLDTYLVTATGGGSGNPVIFTIDPSSSSVCTIAAATVTFDNAGNCIIDANQAGNSQYQPAPQAQQTVTVQLPLM